MKKTILIVLFAILALNTNAQVSDEVIASKRKAAIEEMKTLPADYFKEYYANVHSRMPKKKLINDAPAIQTKSTSNTKALSVPSDIIYPGEFDEVQAVMMTWPYITRTVASNAYAEQLFENKGFPYSSTSYVLEPVYSVPDVSSSATTKLFRSLANGIQQNAQVWINIWNWDDSTSIKSHMASNGTPLTNYRFFKNAGNSFWYRDCGPVAFYFGDNDSIALMDFEYYGGRPLDDKLPIQIGAQAGFPVYTTTIEYEGGNILVDGLGTLFTTDAVYSLNQDTYGLYYETNNTRGWTYQTKQSLSNQQVKDSLTHVMNLSRCVVLPQLQYDGGTGHIDLYTDLVDENTFVTTKHPSVMANLSDPMKVESNMATLTAMNTDHGVPYHNTRIPLPAKNDGTWYTSQTQYNDLYTRSYTNHTFVNKAIMQPVFYNSSTGDVQGNTTALNIMADRYKGYSFENIDVRDFDGYGGAIHCITKQIPAENPVRIYHNPLRWLNTGSIASSEVAVNAICQNKSGIANAKLYYKSPSATTWNEVALTSSGNNMYNATMTINLSAAVDTIHYYISATSNNGKTIAKPITAPNGYYTFVYGTTVNGISETDVYSSINCIKDIETISLGDFYPNPAKSSTKIEITNGAKSNVSVRVMNIKGQVLASSVIKKGQKTFEINTSDMKSGVYWVMFGDNATTAVKKLVVTK